MEPVELPVPPSVNNIWRVARHGNRTRVTLSKGYREWLDLAIILLRMNMPRVKAYPVAVRITIVRGKGWSKGRDADNTIKALVDALVKAERIADDSEDYVTEFSVRFGPSAERACALVTVEPVAPSNQGV